MRRSNQDNANAIIAKLLSFAFANSWGANAEEDEDIYDIHKVNADGEVVLVASYKVDEQGNMQWLTADGNPPPGYNPGGLVSISGPLPYAVMDPSRKAS